METVCDVSAWRALRWQLEKFAPRTGGPFTAPDAPMTRSWSRKCVRKWQAYRLTAIREFGHCCAVVMNWPVLPVQTPSTSIVSRATISCCCNVPDRDTILPWHEGSIAVGGSNIRWCPDGFEFRCDDGSPLRVTFALDGRDREPLVGLRPRVAIAAMSCLM